MYWIHLYIQHIDKYRILNKWKPEEMTSGRHESTGPPNLKIAESTKHDHWSLPIMERSSWIPVSQNENLLIFCSRACPSEACHKNNRMIGTTKLTKVWISWDSQQSTYLKLLNTIQCKASKDLVLHIVANQEMHRNSAYRCTGWNSLQRVPHMLVPKYSICFNLNSSEEIPST